MLLSLEKSAKRVSKNGDIYYYLPRLHLIAELKTCGQSKPTARSRPDWPRDTTTRSHFYSTVTATVSTVGHLVPGTSSNELGSCGEG